MVEEATDNANGVECIIPVKFQTRFVGMMEMYSDIETVRDYLRNHKKWFVRCAQPMKATPLGDNGYTITIGNYGSLGYYLQPTMSVVLTPPVNDHYIMYSVADENSSSSPYAINYRAEMNLETIPLAAAKGIETVFRRHDISSLPATITRINWHLDLTVTITFPPFIYKFPLSVIQKTGNQLLRQIIKHVSPRFSYKVQKDFHQSLSLPIPPKEARVCYPVE
ncbi:MAG TPA: DUF1997 domain-containing protein [Geminocystis sp. M7585_C2015_104]|nr:DUF1997 domain-containing protein [Geminocystis sp. M7585_C2015_104]